MSYSGLTDAARPCNGGGRSSDEKKLLAEFEKLDQSSSACLLG